MSTIPNVYACIAAVQAELAKVGIGKDRSNQAQGFKFRGIDDVYNALAPLMAAKQLVVVPRMVSRECTERQTVKGGILYSVVVEAEFDFISAVDGSKHTARTFGEAMDSGDKATNKAMSAAYKYAAIQTFCIPTEGDNDADAHTPEPTVAAQKVASPAVPANYAAWWADLQAVADEGSDALKSAWTKSSPELRRYLTDNHNQLWEALKAKAAKVRQTVPA